MLADYRQAPIDDRGAPRFAISERLRATLGFLERLTLAPDEVGPADVAPLRAAGVRDEAILDAVDVCVAFHIINRVADATGFSLLSDEGYAESARQLLLRGYKLPGS